MTVKTLSENLKLETLVSGKGLVKEVKTCYCGDLLSWVIGRAAPNSAWITVMGNENAIAVALLADIPMIILAENAELDPKAAKRAEENSISVFKSSESVFEIAVKISDSLRNEVKKEK